ncbi:MAG: polysaccharide deacetylase family protein, partial [Myxococcaceae bacterium]
GSPPASQPATPTKPTTTPVGHDTTDGWKPPPSKDLQGLFWGDKFDHKLSLTFDDGPDARYTPRVLDILKKHDVKATFFVCGDQVAKNPELVRRIVAEGHTLGNHSWDHADLTKIDQKQIEQEFAQTQAAVDKALGYHYELTQVRPPYGATNDKVKGAIKKNDDVAVLWNVDSNDWKYPNNDQAILDNVFKGSSSVYARGGVILFHDVHPQSGRVLDQVIDRLQHEGYKFVKTDKLLEQKYFTPKA